jgi:hypothetical protein
VGLVNMGEVSLDGVAVLVVLVHTSVDIHVGGSGETTILIVSRRTTHSGTTATASLTAGGEGTTAEGTDSTGGGTVVDLLDGVKVKLLLGSVGLGSVDASLRCVNLGAGRRVVVRVRRTERLGVGRSMVDRSGGTVNLGGRTVERGVRRHGVLKVVREVGVLKVGRGEISRPAGEGTNTTSGWAVVDLLDRVQISVLLGRVGLRRVDASVGSVDVWVVRTVRTRGTVESRRSMEVRVRRAVGRRTSVTVLGTVEDNGTRATVLTSGDDVRSLVNVLVLQVDAVVVLGVLVDISVGVDCDRSTEGLATIITGGTTHGSATVLGLPSTLEGSAVGVEGRCDRRKILILVLEVDRVVILVELIHLGVEVAGNRGTESLTTIISRGTTHGGATVGVRVSVRRSVGVVRATARSAHCGTTLLRAEALLERIGAECGRGVELVEVGSRSSDGRGVNVGLLDINGVVILV